MKKNVAGQVIYAQMIDGTNGGDFTATVTVYVTGDNGTQTIGSVVSGICTHKGRGLHAYLPAQAETNFDDVAFTFAGTNAITATVQVYPTFPQTGDNFARLGAPAGASVSADVASVKTSVGAVTGAVGSVTGAVGSVASGGITAASLAADTITAAKVAADVTTEIQAGLATSAALTTAQADLDDLQTRLPAALVSGRIDASVGAMAANVLTATAINADAITAAKLAADVTTELQAGLATPTNITAGTITTVTNLTNAPTAGDLTATMKTSVNAEVVDALNVDTYAEPGQEAPGTTVSLARKINYLYKALRNRFTQDETTFKLYADDATTVDQKATVSDAASTFDRGELGTGP